MDDSCNCFGGWNALDKSVSHYPIDIAADQQYAAYAEPNVVCFAGELDDVHAVEDFNDKRGNDQRPQRMIIEGVGHVAAECAHDGAADTAERALVMEKDPYGALEITGQEKDDHNDHGTSDDQPSDHLGLLAYRPLLYRCTLSIVLHNKQCNKKTRSCRAGPLAFVVSC